MRIGKIRRKGDEDKVMDKQNIPIETESNPEKTESGLEEIESSPEEIDTNIKESDDVEVRDMGDRPIIFPDQNRVSVGNIITLPESDANIENYLFVKCNCSDDYLPEPLDDHYFEYVFRNNGDKVVVPAGLSTIVDTGVVLELPIDTKVYAHSIPELALRFGICCIDSFHKSGSTLKLLILNSSGSPFDINTGQDIAHVSFGSFSPVKI